MSLTLEMRGLAPRTSGLVVGALPFDLHPMVFKTRGIFFLLVSNYEIFLFVRIKLGLSADSYYHLRSGFSFGDVGHRSPYLSNAKRTLYHLSYIHIV